jgi:hypothetical protein
VWGSPVSLTVRTEAPNCIEHLGTTAVTAFPAPTASPAVSAVVPARRSHPPFPPPSVTASFGFKRSAPPKSSSSLLLLLLPHPCSPRCLPLPPLHSTLMRSRRCSSPKPPATASLVRLLPPRARPSSSHSSKCRRRGGRHSIPCPPRAAARSGRSVRPLRPPSPPRSPPELTATP